MVHFFNWWCDRTREICDNQDFFFERFFAAGCKDWGLDHNDIQVCSLFGDPRNMLAIPKSKVRLFFCGENFEINYWRIYNQNLPFIEHTCDLLVGFNFNSEKFIQIPLWMIYWDFWCQGLFQPLQVPKRLDKAVLIASHSADGTRTAICNVVHHAGVQVDVNKAELFPHAHRVIQLGPRCDTKRGVVKYYKYNICPENSIAKGYNTEKIFESVYCGCIPVYWGAPFEPEVDVLNPEYIVRVSPDQPLNMNAKQPDDNKVWKSDALIKIFTQYSKMWVKVWKQLSGSTIVDRDGITTYQVDTLDQAWEQLKTHWMEHNHLFTPRAAFVIAFTDQKLEWEQVFDQMIPV